MSDEENLPGKPGETIAQGGRRCAVRRWDHDGDWYVGTSPRNGDNASVEGVWDDWVTLARQIIEIEDQRHDP